MKYITPQFAAFLTLLLMAATTFIILRNAFGGF